MDIAALLLPVSLFIALLGWLASLLRRTHLSIGPIVRRHWKSILTIAGIFVFLLVDLPYLIQDQPALMSPQGKYWLQTVAGNWSPPAYAASQTGGDAVAQGSSPAAKASPDAIASPYGYAFSVILAILLNNALYLGIVGGMLTIASKARFVMLNVRKIYRYRDIELQADVYDFITTRVKPELAETPAQRHQLRLGIEVLFNAANSRLPEEVKKYWPEGKTVLEEQRENLPDAKPA